MITGTVHTNYSLEAISGPYDFEAIQVLLEMGNGSLGINQGALNEISVTASITEPITSEVTESIRPPFLGDSFHGFKEALAFKESRGDYFAINSYGYLGKYQFGEDTLQVLGVSNPEDFLNNPMLQEEVFYANLVRNKWILRREIKNYTNKQLRAITITESGILAAAHLAGPGNVKKYLRSGGTHDIQDAYGTQISDYLKKFAGYEIANAILIAGNYKGKEVTTALAGI